MLTLCRVGHAGMHTRALNIARPVVPVPVPVFEQYFTALYAASAAAIGGRALTHCKNTNSVGVAARAVRKTVEAQFQRAVAARVTVPLMLPWHRLTWVTGTAATQQVHHSSWIRSTDKVSLYKHLLFDWNCIADWMRWTTEACVCTRTASIPEQATILALDVDADLMTAYQTTLHTNATWHVLLLLNR